MEWPQIRATRRARPTVGLNPVTVSNLHQHRIQSLTVSGSFCGDVAGMHVRQDTSLLRVTKLCLGFCDGSAGVSWRICGGPVTKLWEFRNRLWLLGTSHRTLGPELHTFVFCQRQVGPVHKTSNNSFRHSYHFKVLNVNVYTHKRHDVITANTCYLWTRNFPQWKFVGMYENNANLYKYLIWKKVVSCNIKSCKHAKTSSDDCLLQCCQVPSFL